VYWNPTYVPHKYQFFLIYQASNLLFVAYNIAILRRAAWTHNVGLAFSLLCWFTFWIACLAKASPNYSSSSFVWTNFVNEGTGWSNGVVFLIGMVNANFMYVGVDGAVHLAEDAKNAATAVPWALMAAVGIGFITTFPFVVSLFYCITDPIAILESPVPIFGIFLQATGSQNGATAMTVFLLLTGYFALNATIQTASRLTWSFARDEGLVFSKQLGHIHPSLGVPVWALLANAFVVFIMGCIYLGSTVAFNAIVGTCLILMHLSIAVPVLLLMLRRRDPAYLPAKGHWNMGAFGWFFNFWSVAWALIILVFYCFPSAKPVSGSTMNYASAVLGVMFLFGVINWFVYAKRHFTEPKIDLAKLARLEEKTY
jgi:choline transport protein